ncbi:MAG: sterol desaturase family protein [Beijerinckiaceae bacterium]
MSWRDEITLRMAFFLSVLTAMALWEALAPRRTRSFPRSVRWPANLGIVVAGALVVRVLFPVAAVGAAAFAQARGWGLLPALGLSFWPASVVSFLALDALVWGQHVVSHRVPLLWRVHRMHHADLDYDVTTALRFHPLEIALSMLLKMTAVVALGAPPESVLFFEIALNALAMFNHANAGLPPRIEPFVRWLFVTPDMHRIHHSILRDETDSNFGFNFSFWDRLAGLYRAAPAAGQGGMTIGLPDFREERELGLGRMLTQPFRD